MTGLRPCPLCGGEVIMDDSVKNMPFILCKGCLMTFAYDDEDTAEALTERFNRRAGDRTPSGDINCNKNCYNKEVKG